MHSYPGPRSGLLKKPDTIPADQHLRFTIILTTCLTGLLIHCGFLVLFWVSGIYSMVLVNLISIAMWAAGIFLTRRGRFDSALQLVVTELVLHACAAVASVGLQGGFQYFLWPAACLVAIIQGLAPGRATLYGILIVLIFLALDTHPWPDHLGREHSSVMGLMKYINILLSSFPVMLITLVIRVATEKNEGFLRRIAFKDDLTGLKNRRAGSEDLIRELAAFRRNGHIFSIALIDVDYFKKVNDVYGHEAGDRVLQLLGHYISERLRASDSAVRWGGEEFLLILPGTIAADAYIICDKLRKGFTRKAGRDLPELGDITFSMGLTEASMQDTTDKLLSRADALLYRAKEKGRNRICSTL